MRISDWSSDVCSSDRVAAVDEEILLWDHDSSVGAMSLIREALAVALLLPDPTSRGSEAGSGQPHQPPETTDKASGSPRSDSSVKAVWNRVVEGKRVSERVDIGGRGILKKKTNK